MTADDRDGHQQVDAQLNGFVGADAFLAHLKRWNGDSLNRTYTEMMKYWVKFVACFLIAWLPLLGYPAQVAFCPQMSSLAAQSQMHASHMSDVVPCAGDEHAPQGKPLTGCHGMLGSLACGAPVIPTAYATAVVPSSPVYRAITRIFVEQFIPELPAPPPRSL